MSRMRPLMITIALVACSKSSANQDTGNKPAEAPATRAAGDDKRMPEVKGMGTPGADPAKAGTGDLRHLQPDEGNLAITVPPDAKPGTETTATIKVTPAAGYHVNLDYPTKLTLTPPAGVTLAKSELTAGGHDKGKGDADALDEQQLVISVKLTAAQAGSYTVNGDFKFAVCNKDQCLPKKEPIAIAVAVK